MIILRFFRSLIFSGILILIGVCLIHVLVAQGEEMPVCFQPDPGKIPAASKSEIFQGYGTDILPGICASDLCTGFPVDLDTPTAGFPYTPTLFDADNDGASEIFVTGGHTFALRGDGTFLPGWPTLEMREMGYATTGGFPGPSVADMENDHDVEVMWTLRDWWAGSSRLWCFNGKHLDGTNMTGFPQKAIDTESNALEMPFVLGDTDGDGDLEAWGAHTLGNTFTDYRISGFDHEGTRLFTTDLDTSEDIIGLYFGNLDGTGGPEMFTVSLLSDSYRLHMFDKDGNVVSGYPVTLYTLSSQSDMFGPPVPADFDDDGDLEILLGYWSAAGSIADCYHHDGSRFGIFPITIATSSQLFYLGLGDLTGDRYPELIATENYLPGDYRVFAIDISTGTALPGWPFDVTNWPEGFPAIVDVDNNNLQDVCFTTNGGELYAVSDKGVLITDFPKLMSACSTSGVAVGDIDGDYYYELVAATWDGWVYAWNTPTVVSNNNADWPMHGVNPRNTGVFGDSSSAVDPVPDCTKSGCLLLIVCVSICFMKHVIVK